VNTGPLAAAN